MQGGLHMVSFRKVAVFIGVVGLLFGVASMADAAHTKSHEDPAPSPEPTSGEDAEVALANPR